MQRRALERIGSAGRVYQFRGDFSDLLRTGGRLVARPVGINDAGTFSGFCAHHDNELFRPIDQEPFTTSEDVIALHLYRALAREVWTRGNADRALRFYRELDKGRPELEQRRIQGLVDAYAGAFARGTASLAAHKAVWDDCLRSQNYTGVRYVVFESKHPPPVLCSGVVYPEYDFQGHRLQDLSDPDLRFDLMGVAVVDTPEGSATILGWHETSDGACSQFVQSLASCPDPQHDVPEALLRLVLSAFENIAISPAWWDSIDRVTQERLLTRFEYFSHPMTAPDPQYLTADPSMYLSAPVERVRTNVASPA